MHERLYPSQHVLDELARLAPSSAADEELFRLYVREALYLRPHSLLGEERPRVVGVGYTEDGVTFPPLTANETMEALESLALRFRRLHLQTAPTAFSNVLFRLRQHVGASSSPADATVEWMLALAERRRGLLRGWVFMGVQGLSPREALDLVFNCELFHLDRDEAYEKIENWRLFLAGAVYQQIAAFSGLFLDLALGLDCLLEAASSTQKAASIPE